MIKPVNKIAHIGIAVKKIDHVLPFYMDALGLQLEKITAVEGEGMRIAFLKIGESRIELLEPSHEGSLIQEFIDKNGEGIHHIAFEVDNIEQRLTHLKREGVQLIDKQKRPGAEDANVAFIHPKAASGVLFELSQPTKKEP